jgi:DNA-3-methyladenine glycosylase I
MTAADAAGRIGSPARLLPRRRAGPPHPDDAGHLSEWRWRSSNAVSRKIVLTKRPAFRRLFERFDINRVASFKARDVDRLCRDPSIIRNRLKIKAIVSNARVFIKIAEEHGSYRRWFERYRRRPSGKNPLPLLARPFSHGSGDHEMLPGVGKITPPHEPQCWRFL